MILFFLSLQLLNMVAFIKIRIVRLAKLLFTLTIIEDRKRKMEHILGWLSRGDMRIVALTYRAAERDTDLQPLWLGPAYVIHKARREFVIWSQESRALRHLAKPAWARSNLWRRIWLWRSSRQSMRVFISR